MKLKSITPFGVTKPSYDLKVVPRVRIPPSPQSRSGPEFLMYCVYVLFSATIGKYYCGQTRNLQTRLDSHNSGSTLSNKHGIPWTLTGFINCKSRSEAMVLEKKIKKRGVKRWLQDNHHLLIRMQ